MHSPSHNCSLQSLQPFIRLPCALAFLSKPHAARSDGSPCVVSRLHFTDSFLCFSYPVWVSTLACLLEERKGGHCFHILIHSVILNITIKNNEARTKGQEPEAPQAHSFPCRREVFHESYFHFHSTYQTLIPALAPGGKYYSPCVTVSRLSGLPQAKGIAFYITV